MGLILSGLFSMPQAALFDGLSFNYFALLDDSAGPSKIDVGRRYVVQALVVAPVVVVLDEGADLVFEIAGQEVVLQQDTIFELLPVWWTPV